MTFGQNSFYFILNYKKKIIEEKTLRNLNSKFDYENNHKFAIKGLRLTNKRNIQKFLNLTYFGNVFVRYFEVLTVINLTKLFCGVFLIFFIFDIFVHLK